MDEKIPDEFDIAKLFTQIKPTPSSKFEEKIKHQPWYKIKCNSLWFEFSRMQIISTICIVLILLIGITFLSPNLNTVARRFTQFFSPMISNQVGDAVTLLETRQPQERFMLTIDDAERLAGFEIKSFSPPVKDFSFIGAYYDEFREVIVLQYSAYSGGSVLRFSQQLLDSDFQGIDPQAVVEKVSIGKYDGEYVSGGWRISELESNDDPGYNPDTTNTYWDPNLKLKTLRWTDGNFLYEIMLASGNDQIDYFDKEGLVELAEDLH